MIHFFVLYKNHYHNHINNSLFPHFLILIFHFLIKCLNNHLFKIVIHLAMFIYLDNYYFDSKYSLIHLKLNGLMMITFNHFEQFCIYSQIFFMF